MKYAFLSPRNRHPAIISSTLSKTEKEYLILVLKENKGALGVECRRFEGN